MKRRLAVAVLLILTAYVLHAQVRPRFEKLLAENPGGDYHHFEVWHDRESGQEFICVYSGVDLGKAVSCFTTGRNWK